MSLRMTPDPSSLQSSPGVGVFTGYLTEDEIRHEKKWKVSVNNSPFS